MAESSHDARETTNQFIRVKDPSRRAQKKATIARPELDNDNEKSS